MPHSKKFVHQVRYNDGTNEDLFAFVVADNGGGSLNLVVFNDQGVSSAVNDVPRREKADYGPEGGGVTWHLAP